MEKYLLASGNKHKLAELQRILKPLNIEVSTFEAEGLVLEDVEETGSTFLQNAKIKAKAGCLLSSFPCIADDSGLCVDALGGKPGVFSARYSGEHGNDEANIQKLLQNLKDVPEEKRTAHFSCAICVYYPNGKTIEVEGTCEGKIGFCKKGNNGFGYDPVFMVGDKSFAELSASEKDAISHRGNALRKLVKEIEEN